MRDLYATETRTERINIRCTPSQKAAIEACAAECGMNVSEYLVMAGTTTYIDHKSEMLAKAAADALEALHSYLESNKAWR